MGTAEADRDLFQFDMMAMEEIKSSKTGSVVVPASKVVVPASAAIVFDNDISRSATPTDLKFTKPASDEKTSVDMNKGKEQIVPLVQEDFYT